MSIETDKIETFEAIDNINLNKVSYYFYGNAIDDRGVAIVNQIEKFSNIFKIKYIQQELYINKQLYSLEDAERELQNILTKSDEIIIESTTLEFAENLLLLYLLNKIKPSAKIKIIYVEPKKYKEKKFECNTLGSEYGLSVEYSDFEYIPPFAFVIDSTDGAKARAVALIGFEEQRLGRLLNEDDGNAFSNQLSIIIGLPAFIGGWESIVLQKHVKYFKNYATEIRYAPANNPYETKRVLKTILDNYPEEKMILVPIGTKPNAIGACIFLVGAKEDNKPVAVRYDFPKKAEKRTEGIGKIHIYSLHVT